MQDETGAPLTAARTPAIDPSDPTSPPSPDTPGVTPTPACREQDVPVAARRRLQIALAALAAVVLAADQLTKAWALATLRPGEPVDLVGGSIQLNLIGNAGAAFSLATGDTWVLTLIACAVLVAIVVSARRLGSRGWSIALGLLLGGSLGNLVDRFARPPGPGRGHVVDFIDYFGYFIGNVADIAIVSAAVVIAVLSVRGRSLSGGRPDADRPADPGSAEGSRRGGRA